MVGGLNVCFSLKRRPGEDVVSESSDDDEQQLDTLLVSLIEPCFDRDAMTSLANSTVRGVTVFCFFVDILGGNMTRNAIRYDAREWYYVN